jgi:saccharopine dehydrogenase-like NADP-dependent oxidoreductase
MKKQTAVEWLVEEINKNGEEIHKNGNWIPIHMIEQAKQMEKEQIEIAFAKSYLIGCEEVSYNDANKASENYYNETYGGQDESK